jgi:glycosyltransferase involved in cell wall biosynthesis
LEILLIVENFDNGAVENWLIRVLQELNFKQSNISCTFFCLLPQSGTREKEVIDLGAKVIHSKYGLKGKLSFLLEVRSVLKNGKFQFVISQHDYMSGFYFLSTVGLYRCRRVSYFHNTDGGIPVFGVFKKLILRSLFSKLTYLMSDKIVGVSEAALNNFHNNLGERGKVLYCGIDTELYAPSKLKSNVRSHLCINEGMKLLLFVGRLDQDKNAIFLVHILNFLMNEMNKPEYQLLIVGDGEQRLDIESQAKEFQIESNVTVLDFQQNIEQFFGSADVFVFPRKDEIPEGLGLVIVEAQAAGLPVVTTRAVPRDAFVLPEQVSILSSHDPISVWAKKIDEVLSKPRINRELAWTRVNNSKFNIVISTAALVDLLNE